MLELTHSHEQQQEKKRIFFILNFKITNFFLPKLFFVSHTHTLTPFFLYLSFYTRMYT